MTRTLRPTAPTSPRASGPAPRGLAGQILAAGLARLDAAGLAAARRAPGPIPDGWKPIAPTLLKASDDQTVAAVSAVLEAIAARGESGPGAFDGWGVVVASRYLGRAQLAEALRRFDAEGVWGVSPHLIPHYALHSPAGTLSLALGAHGPNLGVGGGPSAAIDGALTALTWLAEGRLPGVWLVLTGHDPELIPGAPADRAECRALALAIGPEDLATSRRPRLRLVAAGRDDEDTGPADLVAVREALAAPIREARTIAVGSGLRLEATPGDLGDGRPR